MITVVIKYFLLLDPPSLSFFLPPCLLSFVPACLFPFFLSYLPFLSTRFFLSQGLQFCLQQRMILNSWPFCVQLQSAGVTRVCHHVQYPSKCFFVLLHCSFCKNVTFVSHCGSLIHFHLIQEQLFTQINSLKKFIVFQFLSLWIENWILGLVHAKRMLRAELYSWACF